MKNITPFLWFDTQAEEAMNYYVDTFNGAPYKKEESKIVGVTRYEKGEDQLSDRMLRIERQKPGPFCGVEKACFVVPDSGGE